MEGKSIFASKLTWTGVITFAISLITFFSGQSFISENPELVAFFGMLIGVLTVVLRWLTKQPVFFKKPNSKFSLLIAALLIPSVSLIAQDATVPAERVIEVREAEGKFHRAVIQNAVKMTREGKLKRTELVRLRVAMLSPAFRQQVEDLAVVQMTASGLDEEFAPLSETGAVDRAAIDWDALFAFIEKLIPLILKLIDAFSLVAPDFDRQIADDGALFYLAA